MLDHEDDTRARILATACRLFYERGVRAVGVDLVVAEAGVAKTSLYRHFRTKDALVAAFLEVEDQDFWRGWEEVVAAAPGNDPRAALSAVLDWIGARVSRPRYRGCPQINVAAEFADADHPARLVARAHKRELRARLRVLAERLGLPQADRVAGQLALLINGAFVSAQVLEPGEPASLLRGAADALMAHGRPGA